MHLAARISSAAFPWCCNSACLTVDGPRRPAADPWLPVWLPSLQSWQLLVPLQVAGQLRKMLNFWGERKVYDRDTLQQLEAAVLSRDRDAQLQPPKVSCSGHHLASRGSLHAEVCQGHLDTAVLSVNQDAQQKTMRRCSLPVQQACRISSTAGTAVQSYTHGFTC